MRVEMVVKVMAKVKERVEKENSTRGLWTTCMHAGSGISKRTARKTRYDRDEPSITSSIYRSAPRIRSNHPHLDTPRKHTLNKTSRFANSHQISRLSRTSRAPGDFHRDRRQVCEDSDGRVTSRHAFSSQRQRVRRVVSLGVHLTAHHPGSGSYIP